MAYVADLLAPKLATLTHPGDGKSGPTALHFPMFQTSNMPPQMAAQFAADAGLPSPDVGKLFAEAVEHLITTDHEVMTKAEAVQLRAAAAATEAHRRRVVTVGCHCGSVVTNVPIADYGTDRPTVNGPQFIRAISRLDPDCASKHGPL